jgi:hypothetical protein
MKYRGLPFGTPRFAGSLREFAQEPAQFSNKKALAGCSTPHSPEGGDAI